MYNIHLNGDIMRCPDIAAIQDNIKRQRNKLQICQFGICERDCPTWTTEQMFKPKQLLNTRCTLCKDFKLINEKRVYKCEKAQERYNNSIKTKFFKIDNQTYRKTASAAHYLVKTSKARTLFLLLTFPEWKPGFNPYKNENKLNECFSKFMENLRKNYGCEGYIAARELGENTRRYHYHLLCAIPYHTFNTLNAAWCAAISDICDFSKSALRSKKENRLLRLGDTNRALRYICKYISKCRNQRSGTRLIFISNNLFRKPVAVRNCEMQAGQSRTVLYDKTGHMFLEPFLLSCKSLKVSKLNDYCTAFRVETEEFEKLCTEIIYPLFHLTSDIKADFYAYPLSPG